MTEIPPKPKNYQNTLKTLKKMIETLTKPKKWPKHPWNLKNNQNTPKN